MLKNITLGQYFPGESFIHRLDPRTKLLATVALIAFVFVAQGFSGFLLIAAFVLACAASTGIHLKFLIRGLKPIFFIIIFTFILNLFFQNTGEVLVTCSSRPRATSWCTSASYASPTPACAWPASWRCA